MAALYPNSITIIATGSYTIPSGKYAVVNTSSNSNAANFSINGTAVTYIKDSLVDLTMPSGAILTVTNGTVAVIQLYLIPS